MSLLRESSGFAEQTHERRPDPRPGHLGGHDHSIIQGDATRTNTRPARACRCGCFPTTYPPARWLLKASVHRVRGVRIHCTLLRREAPFVCTECTLRTQHSDKYSDKSDTTDHALLSLFAATLTSRCDAATSQDARTPSRSPGRPSTLHLDPFVRWRRPGAPQRGRPPLRAVRLPAVRPPRHRHARSAAVVSLPLVHPAGRR